MKNFMTACNPCKQLQCVHGTTQAGMCELSKDPALVFVTEVVTVTTRDTICWSCASGSSQLQPAQQTADINLTAPPPPRVGLQSTSSTLH